MKLTSSAFQEGGMIPSLYTCEGKDIHPPLEISSVPTEAKSLTLIMDDPDVPPSVRADRMWDHWVVFNIPPTMRQIAEGEPLKGVMGRNTSGKNAYEGPCPPDAKHRYRFKLYALDKMLDLSAGVSKKEVEKAMEGHVLAECRLLGYYEKKHS